MQGRGYMRKIKWNHIKWNGIWMAAIQDICQISSIRQPWKLSRNVYTTAFHKINDIIYTKAVLYNFSQWYFAKAECDITSIDMITGLLHQNLQQLYIYMKEINCIKNPNQDKKNKLTKSEQITFTHIFSDLFCILAVFFFLSIFDIYTLNSVIIPCSTL